MNNFEASIKCRKCILLPQLVRFHVSGLIADIRFKRVLIFSLPRLVSNRDQLETLRAGKDGNERKLDATFHSPYTVMSPTITEGH